MPPVLERQSDGTFAIRMDGITWRGLDALGAYGVLTGLQANGRTIRPGQAERLLDTVRAR